MHHITTTKSTTNIRRPSAYSGPAKPKSASQHTWVDRSCDQSVEGAVLRPGQRVRNAKFGVGQVIAVRPGAKPKVEVEFPVYGKKIIMLDFLEID